MKIITDDQHYTAIAAAIRAQNGSDGTYTPAEMSAAIAALSGAPDLELTALTLTPTGNTVKKTAPAGTAWNAVTVAGDQNLTPRNIAEGIEIYGVTGTLKTAAEDRFPIEYDRYRETVEALYRQQMGEEVPDSFMVLESDTYLNFGYFRDHWAITDYDEETTAFQAVGWVMVGCSKTDYAWTLRDYSAEASTGQNYLRNVRFCTKQTLHYGETTVWPFLNVAPWGSKVLIIAPTGAAVTAELGDKHYTAREENGVFTFVLDAPGTWHITAMQEEDGISRIGEVDVTVAPEFFTASISMSDLPVEGVSLEKTPWSQISAVSRAGRAKAYFALGDKKTVTLTTGEVITLRIIGFDHDTLADGSGTAGITFEMENCLAQTQSMTADPTNAHENGWIATDLRRKLQPGGSIFGTLPAALQAVIRPITHQYSAGSTKPFCTDHAFLLSEGEVFYYGNAYSVKIGTPYAYYGSIATEEAQKIKTAAGTAVSWWERSGQSRFTYAFSCVNTDGDNLSTARADALLGVSFAFCV